MKMDLYLTAFSVENQPENTKTEIGGLLPAVISYALKD